MKLILTSTPLLLKIAAEFCDVKNDNHLKIIHEIVKVQYSNCPSNDQSACQFNQSFMQGTIEKINQTRKAPCAIVAKAKTEMKKKSSSLNSLEPFNCHDQECDIAIDLRGLWGYGCWCNFGSKLTNGKGQPVSAHDKVCKNMQLCLRCAEMDAGEGGYECDAKTTEYNSIFSQSSGQNNNDNSFNSQCANLNPGNLCGTHVCTCEIQLINDILSLVWDLEPYETFPRHPSNPYGGDFDTESQCVTEPGNSDLSCCGKYPFRYPYNNINKNCCESVEQLFNPFKSLCCENGIQPIGNGGC